MRVQFDRFYTYAELTETLEAWASEHPAALLVRVDRALLRGPRHLALHGHEHGDGAGRGEAGRVRPRPDPRDGVHRNDRRAEPSRPPPARRRRTRAPRGRHAHVLRRPPRQPGRRRGRARRRTLPSLERPAVPARGARGRASSRGRRRRRARPLHADEGSERLVEAPSRRRASADRAEPGRRGGRLLPRAPRRDASTTGTASTSRSRHRSRVST